jgi:hypothetical protein
VDFWWSLKSASTAIWVAPSGRFPTQFVLQAGSSRLPLREASGRPALNYQPRLPEAAPAAFFVRHVSYPWLVVGSACLGGFMGQLDASIVPLSWGVGNHVGLRGLRGGAEGIRTSDLRSAGAVRSKGMEPR